MTETVFTPDDLIADFAEHGPPDQLGLFHQEPINAPIEPIDCSRLSLERVENNMMVNLQRSLSRASWKKRPGSISYVLKHHDRIIALLCLCSPTINQQPPRDNYLGLSKDHTKRGYELRKYADLSVCVGVQPLSWHWNIGKLAALLACTTGNDWWDDLTGIVTTSLYGRGSQYNRVYKFLGYTKGHGTSHLPDYWFEVMRRRLHAAGVYVDTSSGCTNPRPRVLAAYGRHIDPRFRNIGFHGQVRAIYYHEAETRTREEVIAGWYERWGLPRYLRTKDRKPPYVDGVSESTEMEVSGA